MGTSSLPADRPFTVGVLGSARLGPEDPRWSFAHDVGAALAARGWTVLTGGYGGLMAAAATGAASRGGRVLGLPMRHWSDLQPNSHTHELLWCESYPERLAHLLRCDAIVALDGGIGTLAELTVAWSHRQTEPAAPVLVSAGGGISSLLKAMGEHLVIDDSDLALVASADTATGIVTAVEQQLSIRRSAAPRG